VLARASHPPCLFSQEIPTMKRPRLASIAIMTAIVAVPTAATLAAPPGSPPTDSRLQGAYRTERDGWVYVHLEGSPEKIGFQHGSLLAAEIGDFLRVIKPFLKKSTGRDWAFYREASQRMLWPRIDDEYRREIDGIVAGLTSKKIDADRWDLVALNANQELPYYYVPWLDRHEGRTPTTHAPGNCSAFIATGSYTRDGRIVMGHNAWTNYVVGTRWNIIFDLKPDAGSRILMDGLPGVIASDDDFGVTSAGMMITETTITQFEGWDPKGKPEFVRARKAMQYSRSIDEFVRIMLDGNNGGYANDWLVGDNKTGEVALFELGLKNHTVRRGKDACFFGANFPDSPKLRREETRFDPHDKASSPNARKVRWEQLVAEHRGKIDLELGKQFETDDFDVILDRREANERTLCGRVETAKRGVPEWDWAPFYPGGTVQSKVTDASLADRMAMWAQVGHHGSDFLAEPFIASHPEYDWMRGLIKDMKCGPWSRFEAGMGARDEPR
jgi:hypothetical protein